MPLQRQIVQTGFRFGIDEGTDPHHVPFGVLTRAENVRWAKSNRIEKRFGMTALPLPTSVSSARRLFTRGSELCMAARNTSGVWSLYSYGQNAWRVSSKLPDVGAQTKTAVDSLSGVRSFDVAVLGSVCVVAWTQGDATTDPPAGTVPICVSIQDLNTGALLAPIISLQDTKTRHVKLALSGSTLYLLSYSGTTPAITVRTMNLSAASLSFSSPTSLTTPTTPSDQGGFDALITGSTLAIAYVDQTFVGRVVQYDATSFAAGSNIDIASGLPATARVSLVLRLHAVRGCDYGELRRYVDVQHLWLLAVTSLSDAWPGIWQRSDLFAHRSRGRRRCNEHATLLVSQYAADPHTVLFLCTRAQYVSDALYLGHETAVAIDCHWRPVLSHPW